jgi:lysophospholipase L1-like esterase
MIMNKSFISTLLNLTLFSLLLVLSLSSMVICTGSAERSCSEPNDHFIYPDNAPDINVFHMVVIGDSIAWGEGLNREEKYSCLVAKWIHKELGRPVDVTVYAHNAAKLNTTGGPKGPECSYPECTNSNPSILRQADSISNPDQVDLILVSGGINDVDVLSCVGNIDIDSNSVREITRQKISKNMTQLLTKLLDKTKKAKIIVTGYYRIVSDNSHDLDISAIYPELYKITHNGNELQNKDESVYKPKLIKNSEAFWDESNICLSKCVNDLHNDRVAFASVDFPISSSVGADDPWLWNIKLLTSGIYNKISGVDRIETNDHKYNERMNKCLYNAIDLCSAFAHPNTKGAQQYNDSIVFPIKAKNWFGDIKPINDYIIVPSDANEADAFHIVMIGDSIAWGNGLKKENRYYYLVADWLHKILNKPVDVTVYAHSGAKISSSETQTGEKIDPNLNSDLPTLMDQAESAKNLGSADLVLISGGINDIDVMKVIDIYTPANDIEARSQSIKDPMKNLLLYISSKNKKAKIIVTNYYPLITDDTNQDAIYGIFNILSQLFGRAQIDLLDTLNHKSRLTENSYTFSSVSLTSLSSAVKEADNGAGRIRLALVNFPADRCYGTSGTWLWKLTTKKILVPTSDDELFEYRSTLCKPIELTTLLDINNYIDYINAMGHPNIAGAQEYARAIKSALNKYQPINISVLNSAGIPAYSAAVVLDTNSTYTADSQGKLAVLLPDGNHTINASKPGYGTGNWSGYINQTQNKSINIALRLPQKYLFTITAVNSANFSVEGTEIKVDGMQRGTTGPTGDLGIELVDGNHTIEANKTGYGSGNWTGNLDHSRVMGAVVKLNSAMEYPFRIVAVNAANYTMEDVRISIDGKEKGATDKRGELKAMLTEDSHTIEANKTDYGSGNWTGALNFSKSKEIVVRLNGALEYPFNVTVVNAANYTVEGAEVSVGGKNKGFTGPQGSLRVMLQEGNQTIRADKAGYGSGNWTGSLNHTRAYGVAVQINGALEYPFNITVMNPARYVVQGADVSVDGKSVGLTDANGLLKAMITQGSHTIEANRTGYRPGNWTGRLNHTQTKGIVIELGGTSVLMDLQPVDLCLVLDTSGSMADPECIGKSKIEAVKEAAQDTIAGFFYPGTSSRVAVVSFCHYSSTVVPFTNNYFEAYANVSQLSADGATSFGQGLSQAIEEFRKMNSTKHVREILFMSDGMHNTPPDYGYYLAICRLMGIRVYTVGYGLEADHDLLKEMAVLSGGDYQFADTCKGINNSIAGKFILQQMNLSGFKPTINASGVVAQNQTVNATSFMVPSGSQYLYIAVPYNGSHLKVTLVGPDGKVADPRDYVYIDEARIIAIRLKKPMPGNWTVQVYGDQVNGTEPFTVYVAPTYLAPTTPAISSKSITIKEISGETLRDYPVQIAFSGTNFPAKAKSDGSDLNIFDQSGNDLKHWVESWDNKGKKAEVWVKVPEIPANGEVHLMMLSGNPGAPAENNGSNIFAFFDDFNGSSIDLNKWTAFTEGNASIIQDSGMLRIHADSRSTSSADLISKEAFGSNVTLRFKANVSSGQNNDQKFLGLGSFKKDTGSNQSESAVCWRGMDTTFKSCHSFLLTGSDRFSNACYPVMLINAPQNRTWEIRWMPSIIEFDPDGTGGPHEDPGQTSESLPLRFGINTAVAGKPSEVSIDWVFAWKPAAKEPLVAMI